MSLLMTGVGGEIGKSPADIPGMVFWQNPSNPLKVWQDSAASVQASIGDTLGAITGQIGSAAYYTQPTGANEPQLVAWSATKNGVFIAVSTHQMIGNASVLSASNAVAGWTEAFVVELPPVLGATFSFVRMTCNAGATKFNVYMDAGTKFYLQTRRVNADTVDALGSASVSGVGGTRYVVVANVDYLSGAVNIYVNGSNSGLGSSGTAAWGKAAACEALNAGNHRLGATESGTNPVTLGTFGEHLAWNRALTAAEVALVTNYLNAGHGVY